MTNQGGKMSFSSPDRSWVKRIITAKLLVFDFLGMITNKSDFVNRTKQFLVRSLIAWYYLGTSKFKIEGKKILLHGHLRTILRHTVRKLLARKIQICLVYFCKIYF